jgi:TPR repeat protein
MTDIKALHAQARSGDPEAQFALGVCYDNADGVPRDPVAAANWYRFAADSGHALAQFHLGLMLNAGDVGFERDDEEAAIWFRKAAEQGIADAQFNLGLMYYNAEGVEQDDAAAFRWFSQAAEQGHAKACFNLGALYVNGHGVSVDNAAAYRLWLMASMQGDPNANANLAMLRQRLSAEQAEVIQAAVVEWFNEQQLH